MEKDYFSHLSSDEKHILKDKGTEAPFAGEYNEFFEAGVFACRACESPLYESNTKFNAGCGWPSFDDELEGAIVRHEDLSGGRIRTLRPTGTSTMPVQRSLRVSNVTPKNTTRRGSTI